MQTLTVAVLLIGSVAGRPSASAQQQAQHFKAWCALYGRVRLLVSRDVECERRYGCRFSARAEEERGLQTLNADEDTSSPVLFLKENAAVWGLIHCQVVLLNEEVRWTGKLLAGDRRALPLDAHMRECTEAWR